MRSGWFLIDPSGQISSALFGLESKDAFAPLKHWSVRRNLTMALLRCKATSVWSVSPKGSFTVFAADSWASSVILRSSSREDVLSVVAIMHLYEDYDFDLSTKYHDNNFYYNGKYSRLGCISIQIWVFRMARHWNHFFFIFSGNEFILPSSSTLDSNNANKMHLSDLISYPDPSAGISAF